MPLARGGPTSTFPRPSPPLEGIAMPHVTITTTATAIATGETVADPWSLTAVGCKFDATTWVGKNASLTADTTAATGGVDVAAGQWYEDVLKPGEILYGRTATGTADCAYETSVA